MRNGTSGQVTHRRLMLAIAVIAVTVVGISTAQVVNTLATNPDAMDTQVALANSSHEIAVTLILNPKSKTSSLVLENTNDVDVHIKHLNSLSLSFDETRPFLGDESVVIKPDEQYTLTIDNRYSGGSREQARVVSMKGRVVDGQVFLMAAD